MRELETKRLRLRYLTRDDTQTMFDNWTSDPEVPKYMTWNAHESVEVTYALMDGWLPEYGRPDCYRWGIERRSDKELMGMIDVVGYRDGVPMVGYCSGKRFWGNGYMTEALEAVRDELFSDGYESIIVEAVDENTGSNRVIQKCGGVLTASEKKALSGIKPEPVLINTYVLHSEQ